MATIRFTPHLRMHLDCPDRVANGETVWEVLQVVFHERPKLAGYILDDQGAVRKHVTIFVNNETIRDRQRLTDRVQPDDEVFVFQALSGG